ncbi:MAG: PKD domain-containing protein, partial [Bacteroidetes bacterium]
MFQFTYGQLETNCTNSNFNEGTFNYWQGCYGHFGNSCEIPGFQETGQHPTHKIIQGPGYLDNNTCDTLTNVFPNESYAARLGDTSYSMPAYTWRKAAELKYEVAVTPDSYLFIYRYSVVLQTGGHSANMQPDFKVMITNEAGTVLDSTCGYYYITAQNSGPPIPGWHLCTDVSNGDAYWKDWTTVGMDLTSYLGQTIYIVFKVRGCFYDTHFGYAYINTYCSKLDLDIALCEGDTNAVLTAPPGFYYYWSTVNGDPTINGDTTRSIIIHTPVTGDEYFCTLTAYNGCVVTISQTLSYTVINASFSSSVNCAGLSTTFTDNSTVNQNEVTNWKWDFGDGSSILEGVQDPTHIFSDPGTYDVTLIAFSTEGCSDTVTIPTAIDSLPNVSNDTLRIAVCSRSSTDITLISEVSTTLFTWTATSSSPDISGFYDNTVPQTYLNDTLINIGASIDSVIYTITPQNNECIGFDTLFTVLVYPLPILSNASLVKSICDSTGTNIDLESNNDSTRFTWTCSASSSNVYGYLPNTTSPDTLIDQVLWNTGYAIDTVYYYILPQSFGCFGDTVIYKVAVYPTPDLSNTPASKAQCNNQATGITLTSNIASTTFTWRAFASSASITGFNSYSGPGVTSIDQTLVNSGTNIDTVTYRLVPKANNCTGDSVDYKVVVFPTPDLSNNPAIQPQCNNQSTNLTLTSNVANTTFTWRAFASSANITGFSDNTGAGVTLIDQILVNSGFNIDTVTYRLMPMANACFGDSVDYKVVVFPTPDLSNSPAVQSQCNNQNTGITLTSNVANTTFTWTCTQTSGNVNGWSANPGPGATLINQTLLLTGWGRDSVIYHLTPAANTCNGLVTDYKVYVDPIPELTVSPMWDSICSEEMTNINLTSAVLNTGFTWTAAQGIGNISGFSDGTGPLIAQQLFNPDPVAGSILYTITPATSYCTGVDTTFTQWVKPLPHLTNQPKGDSICSNTGPNITLTSDVTNTWFTWTVTGSSGNISGFSDQPVPTTLLNQTLTNLGYDIEWATYLVAPTAAGCAGPDSNYVVTVFPVPDLANNPPDTAICNGQPTGLTLLSHVAGTLFTWTASGSSANVNGFSDNSIPTTILNQTLFNTGYDIEWVAYQVTPSANGCNGNLWTYTVTVYPVPDVSNTLMAKEICNNNNTDIDLTSNVSGTLFTWTATGSSANITGYSDNPIPSTHIGDNLINLGDINETVTY